MLVANKVLLITGAAFGIKAVITELFAQHGAKVVVADVNQTGGNEW
jgi:dihydroanticapsin dehydrogenase